VEGRWAEAVVDSSVVVKWFSKEEGSDRALKVMDQHVDGSRRLWVSDLLYHEVANALRYKADFDEEKLNGAVEELFGLQLNTRSIDPSLMKKASAVAYKGDVTVYDAVPVALAQLRGTVCITADEQSQYKRLKPHGYPIALLSKENL
jgi:predicted nucleic acid-binding protein